MSAKFQRRVHRMIMIIKRWLKWSPMNTYFTLASLTFLRKMYKPLSIAVLLLFKLTVLAFWTAQPLYGMTTLHRMALISATGQIALLTQTRLTRIERVDGLHAIFHVPACVGTVWAGWAAVVVGRVGWSGVLAVCRRTYLISTVNSPQLTNAFTTSLSLTHESFPLLVYLTFIYTICKWFIPMFNVCRHYCS